MAREMKVRYGIHCIWSSRLRVAPLRALPVAAAPSLRTVSSHKEVIDGRVNLCFVLLAVFCSFDDFVQAHHILHLAGKFMCNQRKLLGEENGVIVCLYANETL